MKITELNIKPIVGGFIYSYAVDDSQGYYESESASLVRFLDECIENLMDENSLKHMKEEDLHEYVFND